MKRFTQVIRQIVGATNECFLDISIIRCSVLPTRHCGAECFFLLHYAAAANFLSFPIHFKTFTQSYQVHLDKLLLINFLKANFSQKLDKTNRKPLRIILIK